MPVAMSELDDVVQRLAATSVEPSGVSFQGKGLKLDSENDAKEVVDAMAKCTDLTFLNLEGNTLGVEASKAIAKGLETHPELKRALWKDMFTGRMKTEIPKALQALGQGLMTAQARLVELDLSDNAFGPIGVEGLATLLRSPPCYSLQELRLNNNGLGISGGKLLAKSLLDCHNNAKEAGGKGLGLRVFIAGRNRLENEGATALAKVFKAVGTLEEVAMPQNGIYHVGITALSEGLQQNPNLRLLNLNDNTLTAKGAAAISKALLYLPGLRSLNFGDCLLKTKGAQFIAEALTEKHTQLEEVYLSCNEIGLLGGLAIVTALANKKKLMKVDLDGNQFGDDGCEQIQTVLLSAGHQEGVLSLEDDEGVDDEEDADDNEEEDDEDENDGEEEEDEENDDSNDTVEVPLNLPNEQCTVRQFLETPTGERLVSVTTDKLLQEAKYLADENYLENLLPMLMKVAALSSHSNSKVQQVALKTSEELLRHMYSWAKKGDSFRSALTNNALLVHLGLIKSEDKALKVTWNLDGCLVALEHSIKQNVFPDSTLHLLRFFLERPNSLVILPVTKQRILDILPRSIAL
ncbi:ran GTPase-activating protein 1 [Frankliniella occidentalis]|uniref:Ran GTPase-activating protein 1 n=1 Tax=Frankliniella occidentalis TaxID=133901 RepID=A0A6J1TM62_FRAOC|nr:ran GTPase-activating protein 1 [Frankliniella occidentalis]